MSINRKIALFFILILTSCTAFLVYEILAVKDFQTIIVSVVFVTIVFALFISSIIVLKKHMLYIMIQLSEVIGSLIDMRESEVFSILNDDMLSKLQSQVSKLSGILRMQNSKLQIEKDEIKSLISDISHQLKNPLANLNIYTTFLMDEEISRENRREFVRNINSQLEKLNWLMESMIKMSRLESGIIQLNPEINSLNDTLLTSLKQVFQKASKKCIEIDFSLQSDIKIMIDK
ncbi:MAG: sensor histidine kinase, partial [Ruminiclostridium sp.]